MRCVYINIFPSSVGCECLEASPPSTAVNVLASRSLFLNLILQEKKARILGDTCVIPELREGTYKMSPGIFHGAKSKGVLKK